MHIEGNALILGDSSYLEHHGILGQKWGVRRFQNKDGTRTAAGKAREDRRVLKKGTTVKRTSYGMYDETYDNKKYVSTNDDDAGKWSRYIGEAKARQGAVVFENEYKLTRDVAVATGKDICKIIDSEFKNADVTKLKEDTDYAARALRQDLNNMSREERVSLNFAMQTQSGKKIVKLLKKHGYDALEDDHGKNVSKDPVIILDPEKNMKRTRVTANTRYYFDYINHTSIDDSPHLSHHGIKGQRWGVRRFQNEDGTLTSAGKKRYSVEAVDVNSSRKEIKKLVSDFSKKDKEFFFGEEDWYRDYDSNGDRVAKRFVIKEGKNIVAFIDAERGNHYYSNESLNVVVGTAQSARGKGYASILSKTMVDWYEAEGYKDANMLEWNANKDNIGSRKAAEKAGFKEVLGDDDVGYRYSKNAKKELDELSKARMRVKAIDKEVSDKINSDFKKTKLSKISPNTTITPYGEGETGWNSELGFYKSMVVDHYATKWAKKNHAEDIAKYTKATSDWDSAYSKFDKKRRAKHTSIGGTMYIEGNALILGDSSYLEHHGIKGQRWGVRRFQNKDGTRTAAGKKRDTENLKSSQEAKNVNSKIRSHINKQLSSEDLDTGKSNFDFASDLIKDPDFEKVIMPVVQDIRQTKAKYGNKEPYEFTGDEHNAYMNDISRIDNKTGELAITIGLAEKGESHKKSTPPEGEYERVDMFRYALARYLDEHSPDGYSDEGDWIYHSSMEGTLFIEDGTLYLSHHGIKGQRWGVRRFQNRDGSLTNAGRKRLGYATKGATQAVKKVFKAGTKTGAKAVKAVKAHYKKAEEKKIEKKKEKASKTRLGVMANKDLFTNEEIRKLNERFKLEDEMKMATLQKGVEIAKAVGVIAQNVGTVAKAYEDVTGTSLSPIKKAKQEAEAKEKAEDRKRKLAKEDAETKRAEDKEKRDIEDRERRIKFEDEDRVRKQAKEDADAQRAENAEKRAQAKEQRDSSMAVELQRKAKAAADEQEHKAVKAKAESRSAILDVLDKINKIQDHDDDDDHNNPPGGGVDTWNDDDYLNFFKKTGIIHSDISDPSLIQNGVLFVDSSDGLAHHGIKGQRWGVRRFQNPDGSLTEKGRKHYEKAIEKLDRKQVNSDNRRGALERQHPFAVTASAILTGSAYAALMIASAANPAMVVAGSAIAATVSALGTHVDYSVAEAWEARGTKRRKKKRKEYEEMLNHDGMYHVENGTLFIDAGEPYLEHHGVLGMKWGKHLRAGKGPADAPASAGGGGGEDDEKLKEMAKKAGMSVAEYKQKFASKIGGAASKVGEKVYDAAGGSHKKNAEGWRKMAREESNAARASEKSAHENSARAASQDRKYGSGGDVYRRAADSDKENAKTHHSNAKARSERAASEQAAYEKSLAGKYDKMKADRARKKSAKEKKRLLTHGSAEAKRISVKDKHLVINGNRSSGTRGLAVGDTGEKPKSFKEKAYDALGGKYKTKASEAHREMITARNDADDIARRANAQGRAANANKRAGNVREYMANKEGARQLDTEAKGARVNQWEATAKANRAQWKYDHSIAGLYDKATGKYKQVHKRTKVPKTMDQAAYYYSEGPNSKLHNNGSSKAKTAKDQAKAAVWNAADHQIKAKEYNDVANSYGGNTNYYGQAYKNAAERESRLSEANYRKAAALGKQASSETSTSSRPRARKKKHTSGGSGVTVRRPGRKPVSRTKRVTKSSTGVKRRSATGTGAKVRRGA